MPDIFTDYELVSIERCNEIPGLRVEMLPYYFLPGYSIETIEWEHGKHYVLSP